MSKAPLTTAANNPSNKVKETLNKVATVVKINTTLHSSENLKQPLQSTKAGVTSAVVEQPR